MATDFTASSYKARVHAGTHALGKLGGELKRLDVKRAMVLSGESVARNSTLIDRIVAGSDGRCIGSAPVLQRHATVDSVMLAVDRLREAEADCVIAVGAGSAIMAARCAVILLAETAPLDQLITQYPEGRPAISPRLDAAKIPIINVLTAATGAQNRAGSALKQSGFGRRLEVFDPKTRPVTIFWDHGALATAPESLVRSAASGILWSSFLSLAAIDGNPLAQGDRQQAFRLTRAALRTLRDDPLDLSARLDLCAASYLLNRSEDAGASAVRANWPMRVCYALGSGIFTRYDDIDPGEIYLALTMSALRRFAGKEPSVLPILHQAVQEADARSLTASGHALQAIELFLTTNCGLPTLSQLGVRHGDLDAIRDFALQNFNADPRREFLSEQDSLRAVLEDSF